MITTKPPGSGGFCIVSMLCESLVYLSFIPPTTTFGCPRARPERSRRVPRIWGPGIAQQPVPLSAHYPSPAVLRYQSPCPFVPNPPPDNLHKIKGFYALLRISRRKTRPESPLKDSGRSFFREGRGPPLPFSLRQGQDLHTAVNNAEWTTNFFQGVSP
jgi:hypothetical protein